MKKILLICIIVLVTVGAIGATAYLINSFKTDSGERSESMVYINFDSNGGSKVPNQIINKGDSVTEPIAPTREYYTFDGWYLGDTKYVFLGSAPNSNVTLQAKWIPDYVSYNIMNTVYVYSSAGYSVGAGHTQKISGIVRYSLTPGTFQYLNFDTVTVDVISRNYNSYVTGFYLYNSLNPSLKVRFTTTHHYYSEYLDSSGNLVELDNHESFGNGMGRSWSVFISQTVLGGNVVSTYYWHNSQGVPVYLINGVSSPDSELLFDEMFTITFFDENFKAVYFTTSSSPSPKDNHFVANDSYKVDVKYNLVTVTFDPNNGGEAKRYTAVKNSTLGLTYTPTKPNYDFVGWYYGNTAVDLSTYVMKQDITLTARWTPKPVYTVTFVSDGNTVTTQSIVSGHTATEPTAPTKSGSTFLYWAYQGNRFNFSTIIGGSFTLIAVWGQTVTFDSNGGSSVQSQTVVSGQTATEPTAPTKTNYMFSGWTLNNQAFSFSTPITGDITLVASWTAVTSVSYTVTFDSNGGSSVSAQTVVSGQTATEPTAPTKTDYTFAGWKLNNSAFNFSTPITGDITLVASWTAVTPVSYTVTFDSNGGSAVSSQTVVSGQTVTEPTAPTKDGYTFVCWTIYVNDSLGYVEYDFDTPITSSITLLAEWSENALDPIINPDDPVPDPEDSVPNPG